MSFPTIRHGNYTDHYVNNELIEEGNSTIYKVTSLEDDTDWVVKITSEHTYFLELQVCANYRHPNLIYCREIFISLNADTQKSECQMILEPGSRLPMLVDIQMADRYLESIIGTLAFLQDHGIIHGDIKKDNMVLVNDEIKLIDFGHCYRSGGENKYPEPTIRQSYADSETMTRRCCGDPIMIRTSYLQDAMWSLGITILELMTDIFRRESYYILVKKLERTLDEIIESKLSEYPHWMQCVSRCLGPARERPATFRELLRKNYLPGSVKLHPPPNYSTQNTRLDNPVQMSLRTLNNIIAEIVRYVQKTFYRYQSEITNLALEYYLRLEKEYLDNATIDGMDRDMHLQYMACIYLATCVVDEYSCKKLTIFAADADKKAHGYDALALHNYVVWIVMELKGNLMLDLADVKITGSNVRSYRSYCDLLRK